MDSKNQVDPRFDPDSPAYDSKIAAAKIYGKDNIFLQYIERLGRLLDNPHMGGIEHCFRSMGLDFEQSDKPVEERLRMLSACSPLIKSFCKEYPENGSPFYVAREVVRIVDDQGFDDHNLVNSVLDIFDPNKNLKRYPSK